MYLSDSLKKIKFIMLFLTIVFNAFLGLAQDKQLIKADRFAIFRDTLDNKLDASKWLIEANGFIPVPQIITEQALGGLGLMLAPVFIKPNKHQEQGKHMPPDITAAFAGYTVNNTWGIGALRMASLPQYGLKYRVGLAHANVNMDFYRTLPTIGEKKFPFNFESTPVFISVMKEVKRNSNLFVGVEYLYMNSKIKPKFDFDVLPEFVIEKDLNSNLSSLGISVEYDNRDNTFTPNKGTQIGSNFRMNADWTGSDYNFQNFNISVFHYAQIVSQVVSGFRLDTKFQFGDAPFYAQPAINLRGVPISRYQGTEVYVAETEQRYDFSLRWSGVFFTGLAKATSEKVSFHETDFVYNYGVGFRYLLARLFKLRVGVDVAKSNNDWGYYITFGSAWNNRN